MIDEIECPDCEGECQFEVGGMRCCGGSDWECGASGCAGPIDDIQLIQCESCKGNGWREPTQEELDDMAADAFSDMCECEPPMSFAERMAMHAKRDEQWGVS